MNDQQLAREVCYLVALDDEVIWRDASESPAHLPDSRARWEAIWASRDRLAVIAHSHPFGPLGFSSEDESTMSALSAALGRPPVFAVVAPRGVLLRSPEGDELVLRGSDEPSWAAELRRDSGMACGVDSRARPTEAKIEHEHEYEHEHEEILCSKKEG